LDWENSGGTGIKIRNKRMSCSEYNVIVLAVIIALKVDDGGSLFIKLLY